MSKVRTKLWSENLTDKDRQKVEALIDKVAAAKAAGTATGDWRGVQDAKDAVLRVIGKLRKKLRKSRR